MPYVAEAELKDFQSKKSTKGNTHMIEFRKRRKLEITASRKVKLKSDRNENRKMYKRYLQDLLYAQATNPHPERTKTYSLGQVNSKLVLI